MIHAVGPVWHGGGQGEAALLASCYSTAIRLAAENDCRKLALPAISAGVYGYPLPEAAKVAITATGSALDSHQQVEEARFWLFGDDAYDAFETALSNRA